MEGTAPTFFDLLAQWSEIVGGFAFVGVAVLLFVKYALPAVRSNQIARNADLVHAEHRREALKAEVSKARGEVEAADRDAQAIKARAAVDAAREHDRLLAEAKGDGERAVANAKGELERARLAARAQLRGEFVVRALQLARSKADSRIDGGTNARLVRATVAALLGNTPEGTPHGE
jgi:F0F1-type ATP synthase membrane subunit b/b'